MRTEKELWDEIFQQELGIEKSISEPGRFHGPTEKVYTWVITNTQAPFHRYAKYLTIRPNKQLPNGDFLIDGFSGEESYQFRFFIWQNGYHYNIDAASGTLEPIEERIAKELQLLLEVTEVQQWLRQKQDDIAAILYIQNLRKGA